MSAASSVSANVAVTCGGIRYQRWHREDAPTLLLVHGSRAHGGWWTAVAPALAGRFDVIVPDLSGHGDSAARPRYAPELWAAELAALAAECGPQPVSVVGHSMGGKVGVYLAANHRHAVERLILVDTNLRPPRPDAGEDRATPRRSTVHPTLEQAVARFRLRPSGTTADPELLRLVARQAVTKVDGGWTWKFDPRVGGEFPASALHETVPRVSCPVGIIYGQHSPLVGPRTVEYLEARLGRLVPAIRIPGAHHHVPLDAPDACRAAIEELVAMDSDS